jgi:hypothetical protein
MRENRHCASHARATDVPRNICRLKQRGIKEATTSNSPNINAFCLLASPLAVLSFPNLPTAPANKPHIRNWHPLRFFLAWRLCLVISGVVRLFIIAPFFHVVCRHRLTRNKPLIVALVYKPIFYGVRDDESLPLPVGFSFPEGSAHSESSQEIPFGTKRPWMNC